MYINTLARRTVVATLLGALLTSGACGGDSPTAPETISGTFTLRSLDGAPVPVVLLQGDPALTLVGDTLVMNGNSTYRTVVVLEETTGGQTTTTVEASNGTYVRSGSSLTLTDGLDGTIVAGAIQGASIVITDQGSTYVFGT